MLRDPNAAQRRNPANEVRPREYTLKASASQPVIKFSAAQPLNSSQILQKRPSKQSGLLMESGSRVMNESRSI